MEERLKIIEEMPENAEEQPKEAKEQLEAVDERAEGTEEKTESVNERTEGAEDKTEGANERMEDTEVKAENVEERPESTKLETESVDARPESTDAKPGNVEDGSEHVKNAVAEGETEKISTESKSRGSRKKIAGFMELAVAFLLIALSAWLFLNTRGTRLLYVSVATGRVSRYYWIFLLAAVVIGVIGLVTLKSSRREKEKNDC